MALSTLRKKQIKEKYAVRQALMVTPGQWLYIQLRPSLIFNQLNECEPAAIIVKEGIWENGGEVLAENTTTFLTTSKTSGTKKANKQYKKMLSDFEDNGFTLAKKVLMKKFNSSSGLTRQDIVHYCWGDTDFIEGLSCEVLNDNGTWESGTICALLCGHKLSITVGEINKTFPEEDVRLCIDPPAYFSL